MAPSNIIDVTEADFQYEVVQYSHHKPVVVDFWAEWCAPCRMIGPILEKLAEKAGGRFRLAKVDIDSNPNLALRYGVRAVPSVKGFRRGEVVAEFVGVIPEPKIREFLQELAPSPSDLLLEKAESMLREHEWEEAKSCFQDVLKEEPHSSTALVGMAKCLLALNKPAEALHILQDFPASREFTIAETLRPLALALTRQQQPPESVDEFAEAAYQRSLTLIRRGNYPAALDALLDVLRRDRHYRQGTPHKIILALFELLGNESELVHHYRRELASVLF